MHEPLLNIDIPNDAALPGRSFRAGEAVAEKVVIVQQIFTNTSAQENLRTVCRLFAQVGGVRLLAVEGADGQIPPRPEATSVAQLLRTRCRVSAGVEVLLNVDRPDVEAWGVDDLDSEARSLDAMTSAQAGAARREQVFRALRGPLAAAQSRCYPVAVARLRKLQCAVYGRWEESSHSPGLQYTANLSQSIAEVVAAAIAAAGTVGLDLREFPAVGQYQRLLGEEKTFDQKAVTAGQTTFTERLVTRVFSSIGSGGVTIDQIAPIIQFWANENGVSNAEFEAAVQLRGFEAVVGECFQWMLAWLTERAVAARAGHTGSAGALEPMMRLALRLGVPFFDLRAFRSGLAYNREATELSAMGLIDQVAECGRALASRSPDPAAARLFDIEHGLEQLYLALRLESIPADAEATEISMANLTELATKACELAGQSRGAVAALGLDGLATTVDAAREFYERSQARGRTMATNTIARMRSQGDDRAVLVAGGFHERAIARTLEEYRDVSWSVITPKPEF